MQKDSQKTKVYKAEWAIRGEPWNKKFETEAETMKFIRRITESKRVEKKYPEWRLHRHYPVVVDFTNRSKQNATASAYEITLPLWAKQQIVIVHELAHSVHFRELRIIQGIPPDSYHGRTFCGIFLYLTRLFMGKEAYLGLCESFRKHKVKYLPKRKPRPITPEMICRLAAARVEARRRKIAAAQS